MSLIIEYLAEPLSSDPRGKPQRGQLHQSVFIDTVQIPELCYPIGSPAPWATVKAHEEVIIA